MVLFVFFCQLQPFTSCPMNCLFSKVRQMDFPSVGSPHSDAAVRPTGDALCFQRPGCSYLEPNWRHSASSSFSSCLAGLQLGENSKKSRKFYIIRILKSRVYQVWFWFVVSGFFILLMLETSKDKKEHIFSLHMGRSFSFWEDSLQDSGMNLCGIHTP